MLEFVPKVKIPELAAFWAGSLNCGAVGFSGEVEGAPNLKVNGKPGFGSFEPSLGTVMRGLADSSGDWAGTPDEFVAPNPENDVPDELPNENIDDIGSFCSELVVAGFGSVVGVFLGDWAFVDSGVGLWDGKPPNRLGGC